MRLTDRLRHRVNRKQALNNIADYYIGVEQQRVASPPAPTFDPTQTFPPVPITSVRTEPDQTLTQSVDQLSDELDREIRLSPRAQTTRLNQLDAIKRRAGV